MNLYDFGDGNGLVPAEKHANGGGWVANSANVAASAFVGPQATVFGKGRVGDNCLIECLGGDSPTCDKCRLDKGCSRPVADCTGFPNPL